jgi:hypothetical protein
MDAAWGEDTIAQKPLLTWAYVTPSLSRVSSHLSLQLPDITAGVDEVQTLTFPALVDATGGDYVVFESRSGKQWAAALNVSGTDPAPTGAAWAAIPSGQKANVDISGATTAADVAALVYAAVNALTGFTTDITMVDNLDGSLTLTQTSAGPVPNAPAPHNADDSGAGSILGAVQTPGVSEVSLLSTIGIQPGDWVLILEGAAKGQTLQVTAILNSTHIQLQDFATFGSAETDVAVLLMLSSNKGSYQ